MRGDGNRAENKETVTVAEKFLGRGVCAVDLAGAEALFPTRDFEELFALAKERNIPYTIHAGEADGPSSVRAALAFGTSRLGHGVRSYEDEALLRRLSLGDVLLELCPTSNLHTCIFSDLSQYPIPLFLEKGVKFCLNTDNMTVSGTTLQQEVESIRETFSLSHEQMKTMLRNTIPFTFADEATKAWLLEQAETL